MGRVCGTFRRLRNRLFPGALTLIYHRVCDRERDIQLLAVSPRNFEEQLQVLARFQVVPLGSLIDGQSKAQRNSIRMAVTFDDGYVDNLTHAKPLLEKYEIPATVFVAAGYVLNRRPYWWDELEQLILSPHPLPEVIRLTIGDAQRNWHLGDSTGYPAIYQQYPAWNVTLPFDPSPRHSAYRELHTEMRKLNVGRREAALDELRAYAREARASDLDIACTAQQVRELYEPGLVQIGAHTCAHPVLSRLDPTEQWDEIHGSKRLLEEITERPVSDFSYPFGSQEDYNTASVDCVKRSGFQRSCSNFAGHVRKSTDPYQIPRYLVRNWNGDTFAKKLKQWLGH